MSIKILETERLVLQVPELSDLDNLIGLRTDARQIAVTTLSNIYNITPPMM